MNPFVRPFFFVFLFLLGCGAVPWKVESIATGSQEFNSSRLVYVDSMAQLRWEWVRLASEEDPSAKELHLSLSSLQSPFHPSSQERGTLNIHFSAEGGEALDFEAPLLGGQMQLRIPREACDWIIDALRSGQKVSVEVDGVEEVLDPKQFATQYEKLLRGVSPLQNFFKGPFE